MGAAGVGGVEGAGETSEVGEMSAIISECGKYRYELRRKLSEHPGKVLFVMLNPSTADASVDDPTIRRCMGYAKDWGYGELIVCNLFAYRATKPDKLKSVGDPDGPFNEHYLRSAILEADLIICAWGINGQGKGREFIHYWPSRAYGLHYLELSKNGTPKHPLYLKKALKPKQLT